MFVPPVASVVIFSFGCPIPGCGSAALASVVILSRGNGPKGGKDDASRLFLRPVLWLFPAILRVCLAPLPLLASASPVLGGTSMGGGLMAQSMGAGWWILRPGESVPGQQPTGIPYRYDGHLLTPAEVAERVAASAELDAHNLRVAEYRADVAAGRPVRLRLPFGGA